jgi:hypothetical protein
MARVERAFGSGSSRLLVPFRGSWPATIGGPSRGRAERAEVVTLRVRSGIQTSVDTPDLLSPPVPRGRRASTRSSTTTGRVSGAIPGHWSRSEAASGSGRVRDPGAVCGRLEPPTGHGGHDSGNGPRVEDDDGRAAEGSRHSTVGRFPGRARFWFSSGSSSDARAVWGGAGARDRGQSCGISGRAGPGARRRPGAR